jgi:methylenetetrahydrofolate reductase (NADPH)
MSSFNISAYSIRQPVPSIVLFIVLCFLGWMSYNNLPITRFPQVTRFAERCGAKIPRWLAERFVGLDNDADTRRLIAASVAIEQVSRLREQGVNEFHFYTLNRAELTYAICHALGMRPQPAAVAA